MWFPSLHLERKIFTDKMSKNPSTHATAKRLYNVIKDWRGHGIGVWEQGEGQPYWSVKYFLLTLWPYRNVMLVFFTKFPEDDLVIDQFSLHDIKKNMDEIFDTHLERIRNDSSEIRSSTNTLVMQQTIYYTINSKCQL